MEWYYWVLAAVLLLAVGALVLLRAKGIMNWDEVAIALGCVVKWIRDAEATWQDYQGAGPEKKAWVLARVRERFPSLDPEIVGGIIDLVVSWLNKLGWK